MKKNISPGDIFGSWTVLRRTSDKRRIRFICRCECNKEFEVLGQNLTNGSSTKCRPCASHQRAHIIEMARDTYARIYHQARGAIRRCTDIDNEDYAGRGIKVYQEWIGNIKLFIEYLITLPGYADGSLVLDRIDNNGNYEPGNLRFTTWSESNYNRRTPTEKRRVI